MAIGKHDDSRVVLWGDMTEAEQDAICAKMAADWKGNLLAGYATIHYHPVRKPDED